MHRNPPLKRLAALALLLVLVFAEALVVVHSLDFEAHASGDACKICISIAGLGSGAPAKAVPPDAPRTDVPVGIAHDRAVPTLRPERPSARGPPLVS